MPHLLLFPFMFFTLVWSTGCAGLDACPPGQRLVDGACTPPPAPCVGEVSKIIEVGCVNFTNPTSPAAFLIELTVNASDIVSGTQFGASFEGRLIASADLLNTGLASGFFPPFTSVHLTAAEARVQVRRGAQADGDVVLRALLPPGGQTFPFPTSDDCVEGGRCDELGLAGPASPCTEVGFCAVKGFEVPLGPEDKLYTADDSGTVLFGWAELGPDDEVSIGPNKGAFELEVRSFGEPIELIGWDVELPGGEGPFPVAFECTMGVASRADDGAGTAEPRASRSPDAALIACPIQEPLE